MQVLTACMAHSTRDVQLAALRAVSNFIQSLEEPADRDKFQHLIPQVTFSAI